MDKPRCSVKSTFGAWNYRNCKRYGVVKRDDKWYCKQHDPEFVKAKREVEDQKYNETHKRNQEIWDRRTALEKIAKGIETEDLHKYQLIKVNSRPV